MEVYNRSDKRVNVLTFRTSDESRRICGAKLCRPAAQTFLVLTILLSSLALAAGPDRSISQYQHTVWTAKDGSPAAILSIAQTTDGYLWLGSLGGLYRFDGVRFEHYQPRSGDSFPSNEIASLLALPDGDLWIGFRRGSASLLRNGHVTTYVEHEGLPLGRLAAFVQDQTGMLWATVFGGGLVRFEEGRWKRIGKEWNFPGNTAQTAFVDRKGTLWVATGDTIVFLPKGAKSFQPTGEHVFIVSEITEAPDGTLWLASESRVRRLKIPEGNVAVPELDVGSQGILFDTEGTLWATSIGDGIVWVSHPLDLHPGLIEENNSAIEMYTYKEGLTDDVVLSVFQDREANIWVGTPKGLERFRKGNLVPVFFPPGYARFAIAAGDQGTVWTGSSGKPVMHVVGAKTIATIDQFVNCAYRDPKGSVWLGSIAKIYRIDGEKVSTYPLPFPGDDRSAIVAALTQDHTGRLWISTEGHGVGTLEQDRWQPYKNAALPDSMVTAAYTDAKGRVWFGYAANLVAVLDDGLVHTFTNHDGIAVGGVKVISGRGNNVWIGGETGIAVLQEGRFRTLGAADATPLSSVSGIVETADGSLWLGEARGVVDIPAAEVQAALRDPGYKIQYRLFAFDQGLPGGIQQVAPPTATEGTDGRLWFATYGGLVWVDPGHLRQNLLPPPVYVSSLSANGKEYSDLGSLRLPARTTNLQIAYTALSLSAPERVHYRYKLDGVDQDWQDSGSRRTAFYTNLGPGAHHFQVIASNNDGVWNNTGAAIDFTIQPAFNQTSWFLALCIAGTLAILYMLYLLRVRQVAQQVRSRMQERLDERERIARDLHDTLLQSVQGLVLKFQGIAKRIPPQDAIRQEMEKALDLADEVVQEGRERVRGLRYDAVSARDLPAAFRRIQDEFSSAATTVKTIVEGTTRELHPVVLEEAYFIGREALVNALTHSGAETIEVEISYDARQFRLRVRDNGRGIDPEILQKGSLTGHWGLPGMRERAGKIGAHLGMRSSPAGTEIELAVPAATAYRERALKPEGPSLHKAPAPDAAQEEQQQA